MNDDSNFTPTAGHHSAADPSLESVLDDVEADLRVEEWGRQRGQRARAILPTLSRYAESFKQHHPDWPTLDTELAAFVRRVEALRNTEIDRPGAIVATITVNQLAKRVDVGVATARKLLDEGRFPGARRKSPGVPNSPWIIPADVPAKYLTQLEAKEA